MKRRWSNRVEGMGSQLVEGRYEEGDEEEGDDENLGKSVLRKHG